MKILVVSDTHGKNRTLEQVLEQVGPVDMLVHCGDIEGSEDYIRSLVSCPVHMVAGNNDFFSDLEREEEFMIGEHRVMLTHGHYYYVFMGAKEIRQEARDRGCDVVLFGHTHKPLVDVQKGVAVCNPGSLSYPRQEGRRPSYLIIELDREGQLHYTINYL
ncbi:MAG: metallophosphoesterase [Lachnospiraceae bacterium]|jgi:putative phosphoesterase|nr:metallophosphoesterase [Lachnospiraceae bacterium]